MRHFLLGAALVAGLCAVARADQPGSNLNPLSFGNDQMIIDIDKVAWEPLQLEGLPAGVEIATLRGDLAKGEAEILLRLPSGYTVPQHTHMSDELYVWLEGAFTLVAHDGTRTRFDARLSELSGLNH